MLGLLASIVLTFAGNTGTFTEPCPVVPGPNLCAIVNVTATFELGAEAWGEHLLSSAYTSHALTTVGWSLTSGGARIANGRLRGDLAIAGTFADTFDGAIDFAGASGQNVTTQTVALASECVPVDQCGPLIIFSTRDWMVQNTWQQWLFQPGVVAETHLTTRTAWSFVATVEVY